MSDQEAPRNAIRAAVYSRVSTDEGLHLEFNSLDAQREACEAYIKSQKHEGWVLSPERYDDGGYSGGTLERPALKQLLADIASDRVDVIVVYKIDRLSRSLADFAKIVEVLDLSKGSFVSITQAFNTSTSMGRLTLNVLLSFAQFEREVGAERVRDKIAASKKKGMWMGGVCPLGYDVRDRRLIVNDAEATTIRAIFNLYLELGSVILLEGDLARRGIRSKLRLRMDGTSYGGKSLTRGALYSLLQNRTYIGQVCHRGTAYPGQQAAILDEETFASVQTRLAHNRRDREFGTNYDNPALLAGLVWDSNDHRMSPSHSTKGPTRYRYYSTKAGGSAGLKAVRVPAADLDRVVINRIATLLRSPREVHDLLEPLHPDAVMLQAIIFATTEAGQSMSSEGRQDSRKLLLKLVSRVQVLPQRVKLRLRRTALIELAGLAHPESSALEDLDLNVPCRKFRRAREVRLAIAPESPADAPDMDPALIKLVTKAWAARQALMNGAGTSLAQVAAENCCEKGYFSVLVKLGFLDPNITATILSGRQPEALTRQQLVRKRGLPMDWQAQRTLIESWCAH